MRDFNVKKPIKTITTNNIQISSVIGTLGVSGSPQSSGGGGPICSTTYNNIFINQENKCMQW